MKLIDKERFEAFEYVIPPNVDEESFGLGVETVLERIDDAPIIYPKYGNNTIESSTAECIKSDVIYQH